MDNLSTKNSKKSVGISVNKSTANKIFFTGTRSHSKIAKIQPASMKRGTVVISNQKK
jgi:hypothetical protein